MLTVNTILQASLFSSSNFEQFYFYSIRYHSVNFSKPSNYFKYITYMNNILVNVYKYLVTCILGVLTLI